MPLHLHLSLSHFLLPSTLSSSISVHKLLAQMTWLKHCILCLFWQLWTDNHSHHWSVFLELEVLTLNSNCNVRVYNSIATSSNNKQSSSRILNSDCSLAYSGVPVCMHWMPRPTSDAALQQTCKFNRARLGSVSQHATLWQFLVNCASWNVFIIIRLHQMHETQTIVADGRGVCPLVCLSVTRLHSASLCRNGWTDQDPVCGEHSWGTMC